MCFLEFIFFLDNKYMEIMNNLPSDKLLCSKYVLTSRCAYLLLSTDLMPYRQLIGQQRCSHPRKLCSTPQKPIHIRLHY